MPAAAVMAWKRSASVAVSGADRISLFSVAGADDPGIKAAILYNTKYNIPYAVLPLEKDIADSVEKHGIDKTRDVLLSLLKEKL